MNNEITLALTPYQVTYLKELLEKEHGYKGYGHVGIYKGGNSWDKVMLEGLIGYFKLKNRKHFEQGLENSLTSEAE